jgi:dimethylglycine dehydrogenase
MPEYARVVVIGGGCVGTAVLYGLAKRGWTDSLLLERAQLAGASTRLAGGFIPSYVRSDAASRMINKTIAIYAGLEADTGQAVGWRKCGQMRIARDPVRLDEYRSYMNAAEAIGANARLLSGNEAVALCPLIETADGILGALYHPDDGYVDPTAVTTAMGKGSRERGARIRENAKVVAIGQQPSGEWQVTTNSGEVICEHVVLATGTYARQTGAMLGLDIPAAPIVVQYWLTDPIAEIAARRRQGLAEMPITRDDHFLGYLREEGDGLLFGTYERPEDLKLFDVESASEGFENDPMPPDFASHAWGFQRAAEIMPVFSRAAIRSNRRGPMQMTGDGMPLVGPAWGQRNVWLAEGVPGGILWGGAIGHFLSEWIVEGGTSIDMNEVDPRRFGSHATKGWVTQKVVELWGAHSDILLPGQELPAGRPAKVTPAHDRFSELGAVWGASNGWEVANWYAPDGVERVDQLGYRNPGSGRFVAEEALAVRTNVGLFDLSPSAKFEITGRDAAAFLEHVLANALPPIGSVGAGYQLFEKGGVRAGYSVARLAADFFYLVSSPRFERLNFDELQRSLPTDGSVALHNVTMARGCLGLAGPNSRLLLEAFGGIGFSNDVLPPASVRTTSLGLASDVRLMRIGSTGELGWQIDHPIAYQRYLLEQILAVGKTLGLRLVGQRALDVLRLEKSYRAVGPDLNAEVSALEAGLDGIRTLETAWFIGSDALRALRAKGPTRRIATIAVYAEGANILGCEGVYQGGKLVGRITSGAFSPYFGHHVALALLPAALDVPGTEMTVPVLDAVCTARVIADAPYDPLGERARA